MSSRKRANKRHTHNGKPPDRAAGIIPWFYCGKCDKQTYPSAAEAKRAARRWHQGQSLETYRCPVMDGWHIANKDRSKRLGPLPDGLGPIPAPAAHKMHEVYRACQRRRDDDDDAASA